MKITFKHARQIAIAVIGATLLVLGVAFLVLPGPGVLIFAAGLALLSLEFVWARTWLLGLRRGISRASRNRRIRG